MQRGSLYHATWRYFGLGAALLSTVMNVVDPPSLAAETRKHPTTATPIQHVIVIIGENRSFDHVYATYKPKNGQTVSNLLSKGIINADGTPGPNFALTAQNHAVDNTTFTISPGHKTLYPNIPAPGTGGAPTAPSDQSPAPFATRAVALLAEPDLFGKYNQYLLTGATGLPFDVYDTRIPHVPKLGQGVFPLTPALGYDDYAASPVHRFYQMWQQEDCSSR